MNANNKDSQNNYTPNEAKDSEVKEMKEWSPVNQIVPSTNEVSKTEIELEDDEKHNSK